MSNSEGKSPVKRSRAESMPDPDVRFRYIGFGVYPKRIPGFWKSDKEATAYAERVKLGSGFVMQDRDSSLLHVIPVSKADRIVITVVALMLVATLAMPWGGYSTTSGADVTLMWPAALGLLFGGLSTAFGGGLWVGLSAILGLVIMLGAPIIGLWTLVSLWGKTKTEEAFLKRLRLPLNLGYLLFFSGIVGVSLSFFGGDVPGYASWGLRGAGESFGILTLVSTLSYGAYAPIALGLVAGAKSSDL